MIRKTKAKDEYVVNLDGPDGNAFALMGLAGSLATTLGLGGDKIITEMKSGDYKNLVKTFDEYFGSYVVLETTNEELLNVTN